MTKKKSNTGYTVHLHLQKNLERSSAFSSPRDELAFTMRLLEISKLDTKINLGKAETKKYALLKA